MVFKVEFFSLEIEFAVCSHLTSNMTLSLDETYKLEVSDKITARQENPAVTDETFSFSPTAEMTEVSFEQIYPTNLFGDDCF